MARARGFRFGWQLMMSLVVLSFITSGALRLMGDGRAFATALGPVALADQVDEQDFAGFDALNRLIADLNAREAALDTREQSLTLREKDVSEARRAISRQLDALTEAEARLSARMAQSAEAASTDLETLTQVYEAMKPSAASELFTAMDPNFAAEFLARMAPEKAAQIFTHFAPDTAYALTAVIAGRNANAATE